MPRLNIVHTTDYQYDAPVEFGLWRLLMRPLDSHSIRVLDATLEFTPAGVTRWASDLFGNSVCYFQPQGASTQLKVVNRLTVERFPTPLFDPQRYMSMTPILYDANDTIVLDPFRRPAQPVRENNFIDWLSGVLRDGASLTLADLLQLNARIHADFKYGAREEEGVQSPGETVTLGSGTCRDFAWLMIESARQRGLAARFVTGYLFSPNVGTLGAGATHAWCEVFVPQLGWLEFDPTNGLTESRDLIRVAATRTFDEASPMYGTVIGAAGSTMTVDVKVERAADAPVHIHCAPSAL